MYLSAILGALFAAVRACTRRRPGEEPDTRERRRLLAWVILAGLLAGTLTQATVYAGTQTVQIFFIFLAMSAGIQQADFSQARTTDASDAMAAAKTPAESLERLSNRRGYAHRFSRTL